MFRLSVCCQSNCVCGGARDGFANLNDVLLFVLLAAAAAATSMNPQDTTIDLTLRTTTSVAIATISCFSQAS